MSRQAWLYARGQWSQIEDLIDTAWPEDESVEQEMRKALESVGYEPRWTQVLGPKTTSPVILFQAGSDKNPPYPFAIEVTGLNSERIYVADVPSLLQIAPLVRALELADYVAPGAGSS